MAQLSDFLFGIMRRIVGPSVRGGVGGTAVHGGYLRTEEKSASLIGRERYRTFSEMMLNTSVVATGVRHFLNLVSKPAWKMEPANDSAAAREVAEFLDEVLDGMETPWYRIVRRAAMYRFYGFSCQEWIAGRRRDGKIVLKDIEARPQITIEQWDIDVESSKVRGIVQVSPQDSTRFYVPREKLLYVVDDAIEDTPEGVGLLRHCAEPVRRLRRYEQLEGYGYETDLRGIPKLSIPYGYLNELVTAGRISETQRDKMVNNMLAFSQNHVKSPSLGIAIDSLTYQSKDSASTPSSVRMWDVDLLKGDSSQQQQAMLEAIRRVNLELARILGIEGLLVGDTGAGSLAMARDKSQTFALTCDSAQRDIVRQTQKDVVQVVCDLNGIPPELYPKPGAEPLSQREISEITTALKDMAQAGAVLPPNDPAVNTIRRTLGLPEAEETPEPQMEM